MKKRRGRTFRWIVFLIDILLAIWISTAAKAAYAPDCGPEPSGYEAWNGGATE